jgi:primosomal protein N' (replication factor Y)
MTDYKIALIALQDVIYPIDKLYSYIIPECLKQTACIGARVVVPFGAGNRKQKGIILHITDKSEFKTLKPITMVVDNSAIIDDEFIKLTYFLKERCFCTYFEAFRAMLPTGLGINLSEALRVSSSFDNENTKLSDLEDEIINFIGNKNAGVSLEQIREYFGDEGLRAVKELKQTGILCSSSVISRKTKDAMLKMIALAVSNEEILEYKKRFALKFPNHITILEMLSENGEMSEKELIYMTGVSSSNISTLIKRGLIESFEEEFFRRPVSLLKATEGKFKLSDSQNKAYHEIAQNARLGFTVSLLNGVTGSGKTHIFLKLTEDILKTNKGVIVLVPEISLTSQMLNRFFSQFGDKVAILHSGLSLGERLDEWKRIKNGTATIVVGTRSAIFAPIKDLGLIIIDEEQEHTYKSEMSPRFHAKDVAKFRCAYHKAALLLSSATPSVEAYHHAVNGKYKLVTLNERYNNAALPNIITVDMRAELKNGNTSIISDTLRDEIGRNIQNNEQTILFINRRGYNSFASCRSCGYVALCPNCNISLTFHSKNNRLMCHYCGHSIENLTTCPECNEQHMRYFGSGTQKVEAELEIFFPEAKICRMDADTTVRKSSHEKIISEFSEGKFDILVGTQMVTKGLDFPNVTLVGVVAADLSLFSDDFRANERTFDLITQVVGRAGRGKTGGRAVIQTYSPENKILNLAFTQDYKDFFEQEIALRRAVVYPPFCDICQLIFDGEDEEKTLKTADNFANRMKELIKSDYKNVPIIGLGPNPAVIAKINNRFRFKLILKCKNNRAFREFITFLINEYHTAKANRDIYLSIDLNPEIII